MGARRRTILGGASATMLIVWSAGCESRPTTPAQAPPEEEEGPPPPPITLKSETRRDEPDDITQYHGLATLEGVRLRYRDSRGKIRKARRASKIPRQHRNAGWVDGGPLGDLPEGAIWVADLTDLGSGSWIARATFEADYKAGLPSTDDDPFGGPSDSTNSTPQPSNVASKRPGPIIVYRTSWCGYCKRLVDHLDAAGIAYVPKDIETSPKAADEVRAKLESRGVAWKGGVPVTDWRGQMVQGYSPETFNDLIQASRG